MMLSTEDVCLLRAYRKLPERDRLILDMYSNQDISVEEIARTMNMIVSKVENSIVASCEYLANTKRMVEHVS